MTTRASAARARAISTSWRAPGPRSPTSARGDTSRPTARSRSRACASSRLRSSRKPRRGRRARKRFSATLRLGRRFSSWWMYATPRAMASAGPRGRNAAPARRTSPASGKTTPPSTFMSVDLPAPFSPTIPSTRPTGRERQTPFRTGIPENALETRSTSSRALTATPPSARAPRPRGRRRGSPPP